jgi:hypothetical protein
MMVAPKAVPLVFGGFLRAAPLPRDPPREVREVDWDGRQSGGFPGIIPHG